MTGKARLAPSGTNALTHVRHDRSRSKSRRRQEALKAKPDLFDAQLRAERKREETKKELKSLLTKFIGPDRTKYAVKHAQHKMGVMHDRLDKATTQMRECN